MGLLYVDTGGAATSSGCTDVAAGHASLISGTNATWTGTTTVTLDGSPNLSGLVTSGANQSTINIAGITNANRTIMWITGFDDTAKTVTTDAIVTGVSGKAWVIGGQYLWPGTNVVNVMEGAIGLGDSTVADGIQFNQSPASKTVTYFTSRQAGISTKGQNFIQGKAGVRPLLLITNTTIALTITNNYWRIENLEIQQQGASGNATTFSGVSVDVRNVKVTDGGAVGITTTGNGTRVTGCEASGVLTTGIGGGGTDIAIIGSNSHDNGGDGFLFSSTTQRGTVFGSISDTNAGRGIFISGSISAGTSNTMVLLNNTIYTNGNSGLEVTDPDANVVFFGNIFMNNGDAAGEYNVEFAGGAAENVSQHGYNCFNTASAGGSGNLLNVTANSTEITTDPSFTNAAGGDFSLGSSSPCKATGFPGQILGGNLGYMDMGAVQRQESGAAAPFGGSVF